ncbi:MAG: diguanylate cyclase, partial [Chromatiales bacterium]
GPRDHPAGAVWTYLVPGRFREHFTSVLRRRREGGGAREGQKPFEVEARTRGGDRVAVEVSLAAVQLPDDLNVIGIFRDVSRRREMEARMAMAARVMETAMEGVMVTNPTAVIETVNPAFSEVTGYSAEEAVGRPASILKSGRHDPAFYAKLWKAISGEGRWAGEIWNRRKSGEVFPELLRITAIRDEQGAISHFVGVFSDITHFKLNETRLEKLAYSDALTGLPNRIVLMDRLGRAVARARRDGESLAVYFLDLDGFKEVNDRFGHLNGDRLLQTIARRLVAAVRDEDTVARLGGDEFALILRSAEADDPAAGAVADKLRLAVSEEPYALEGASVRVSVSVGVSRYPKDGEDPELLLRRADEAMYRAKAEGKDRFRLYGV